MERVETIENVYLVAYRDKSNGKLGSMRLCEADDEKATALVKFMYQDLENNIRGLGDRLQELYKASKKERTAIINEYEEMLAYFKNIEVVIIKATDAQAMTLEAYLCVL